LTGAALFVAFPGLPGRGGEPTPVRFNRFDAHYRNQGLDPNLIDCINPMPQTSQYGAVKF
jgi:hypothetical protein